LGLTMKLIRVANRTGDTIEVWVQPTFLAKSHPLAAVNNEYNAVFVSGEQVGETMFYGPGAGSLPTATAVMSDVVAVIKNKLLGVNGKNFVTPRFEKVITPESERLSQFYLRLLVKDELGAFATISDLFNREGISFERILQTPNNQGFAEIVVVTHETSVANFKETLAKLDDLAVIEHVKSYFRVEGDVQ